MTKNLETLDAEIEALEALICDDIANGMTATEAVKMRCEEARQIKNTDSSTVMT